MAFLHPEIQKKARNYHSEYGLDNVKHPMADGTSSEEGAGIIKHTWDNLLLIPLESLISLSTS